ncbi:MAG: type I-U CRISPR-associated helicase/endonuclease Cas3, partial [Bryobacteraceae bacterium]
ALTRDGGKEGYEPLRWQRRLFDDWFSQNRVPRFCDLPTGMGKTNVIHLWLIALLQQLQRRPAERLPIRLVYVVDRRTVIDQATTIAETIRGNLADDLLCVSTLRGQRADNRDWVEDPSRPAIIIGTVDMIGSRLLFSGYRSSYKARPLDAGMLGQDTLLVLDEAHLSEPFKKLVEQIGDRGEFQRGQGLPMRVMCMSATGSGDDPNRFKLEPSDLEGTAEENPIVQRYEAKKWVTVHPADEWKLVEKNIVDEAATLAGDGSRVVVFVRRPDDADGIRKGIQKKLARFPNAVEVLTGTMRGLERDGLFAKGVFKRFLDGEEKPEGRAEKGPSVLVSTSAGEVGFDLNADHMVCDAAPLDSMIQRLGRVNRRGYRDATVEVFPVTEKGAKKGASDKPKHTCGAGVPDHRLFPGARSRPH